METYELPLVNAGGLTAQVDGDYDGEWLSTFRWRLMDSGYIMTDPRFYGMARQHRYLHRMAYGESLITPGWWVTNLSGNKFDCRTANLVCLSPSEIIRTRRPQSERTRRVFNYRGVISYQRANGEMVHAARVGTTYLYNPTTGGIGWDRAEDAALVYDREAYRRWGKQAILNFPDKILGGIHGNV